MTRRDLIAIGDALNRLYPPPRPKVVLKVIKGGGVKVKISIPINREVKHVG